jgi:hypothetical protein
LCRFVNEDAIVTIVKTSPWQNYKSRYKTI